LITPVGKPRMTQRDRWYHRKSVDSYWAFKNQLVLLTRQKNFVLEDEYGVVFYLPIPESWSKRKKESMDGCPHQQKPDLDNLIKGIQDCLKVNDAVIYKIEASKYWGREGKIVFYNL
jgi:Holliday junction resolvase RusA-like endonuclease